MIGWLVSAGIAGVLFAALPAAAWPPTYSAELEFTSDSLRRGDYGKGWEWAFDRKGNRNGIALEKYEAWIRRRCEASGCRVQSLKDETDLPYLKVSYPDGFHFLVTLDPGILEAKTKPATREELEQNAARLQADLFDGMADIGLAGSRKKNAGHIHIGLESAFGGDGLLLRNFIVDFSNHPELATGGLSAEDRYNALPLPRHDPWVRERFAEALKLFDSGRLDARGLLGKLNWALARAPLPYETGYDEKYNALNLYRTVDRQIPDPQRTIEVRSIAGYERAGELVRTVALLEARLEFLRRIPLPIAYVDAPIPGHEERARRFARYIREAGLTPADYEFLLPASWLEPFRRAGSCAEAVSSPGP